MLRTGEDYSLFDAACTNSTGHGAGSNERTSPQNSSALLTPTSPKSEIDSLLLYNRYPITTISINSSTIRSTITTVRQIAPQFVRFLLPHSTNGELVCVFSYAEQSIQNRAGRMCVVVMLAKRYHRHRRPEATIHLFLPNKMSMYVHCLFLR
jgi:hypothetical protein